MRAESEAAGEDPARMQSQALKQAMAPALAALGDAFYWATLRPAAGMLGVMCILMGLLAELVTRTWFESQGRLTYLIGSKRNLD